MHHKRKKSLVRLIHTLVFIWGTAGSIVPAAQMCVSSVDDLKTALNISETNNQDDTIMVVQGTYNTDGSQFYYSSIEAFSISLLGGYTANCSGRELNPENTILDGNASNRVLQIVQLAQAGTPHIQLQGFTIQNGNITTETWRGAGASLGNIGGFPGNLTVDFNIFRSNSNTGNNNFGGGLAAGSDLGDCLINNNLFYGNSSDYNAAAELVCNGDNIYFNNNTLTNNEVTGAGSTVVTDIGGSAHLSAANNISWNNLGNDLNIRTASNILLNNNIETLLGSAGPGSENNLSVDPKFVTTSNFRLQPNSPLINQGTNSPPGGLPVQDLDGNARIAEGTVDLGVYEYSDTGFYIIPKTSGAAIINL